MPVISAFYGILIRMFFDDHNPPHFHAVYQGSEAKVGIQDLKLAEGSLPPRAQALVLEWAKAHQNELLEDWELCRQHRSPKQIMPLE